MVSPEVLHHLRSSLTADKCCWEHKRTRLGPRAGSLPVEGENEQISSEKRVKPRREGKPVAHENLLLAYGAAAMPRALRALHSTITVNND